MEATVAGYPDIRRTERERRPEAGPEPYDSEHLDRVESTVRCLEFEARAIAADGACGVRRCACGSEMFAWRRTLENSPACHKCGSNDVQITAVDYVRVLTERAHGPESYARVRDRRRQRHAHEMALMRAFTRRRHERRACAPSDARHCRSRRTHRSVARPTVGGDSGDDPPEPPGSRRHLTSEVVPC